RLWGGEGRVWGRRRWAVADGREAACGDGRGGRGGVVGGGGGSRGVEGGGLVEPGAAGWGVGGGGGIRG
ncbi:hypothetical protein, partial [Achromobacter ruhlandii]|uniref:hypothetical protein n=1 Tax=Achromobacter ruhlandii TaxID=72557 RepID=UPI001B8A94F1